MLPRLLLIRSPPLSSRKPWIQTFRGASRPALQSIAGQKIVWKRAMSLPMTWRSAGHQRSKASGSVEEPGAGDVVDEGVVPDVDRARLGVPRAVLALGRLAVLADRERDAPVRAGARDREVLEAAADEAEHLVAPEVGLDGAGVVEEPALEALLVGRQAEEPVPLGQPLERRRRGGSGTASRRPSRGGRCWP